MKVTVIESITVLYYFRNPDPCKEKGQICKNVIGYYLCHCPTGMRRNPLKDTCEGNHH